MARTLPKPTVAAIETAIQIAQAQNKAPNIPAIAAVFFTTYETVSRIRRRLLRFEFTGVDERKRSGPKYLKSQNEEAVVNTIRLFVEAHPGTDQKAVCYKLEEVFGVRYSQSTVSNLMKVRGIPHKKTNKFYKKAKLVSTHPNGMIMPLPEIMEDRTNVIEGVVSAPYVSPYAGPVVATSSSGIEISPAMQSS
ncbi:hypothetical protein ONS95_011295 [Cadophora gregata]|uniref:uncharacterized protein n=1 Tax=Cadophora gregata TaxID=51156 RepID=UPI0026DB1F4E|nr:uncharacterized protein ONS95_011295 [Cadophora gregata]KAK0119865.1 hypothetical protein ONS95_011295 [Cadophora gregata]KAK0120901.1 hypothetical protein ONS96_011098 [Cadophora gregata f. sp. sojae]